MNHLTRALTLITYITMIFTTNAPPKSHAAHSANKNATPPATSGNGTSSTFSKIKVE